MELATLPDPESKDYAVLVAAQNDVFRRASCGRIPAPAGFGPVPPGKIVLTRGVAAMGEDFVAASLGAVAAFDDFPPENDPAGFHDFGAVEIGDQRLFWKIDMYDRDYRWGAENPADLNECRRVLTILLPSEY